jgi:hypothetical protein
VSVESALKPKLRRLAVLAAILGALAVVPATASAAGGSAMGWGYNYSGQVGNGTPPPPECDCEETPVPLLGVTEATEIAAGYEFGLALLADGRVMSWGYNYDGELGNGTTYLNRVPPPVPGLSGAVAVAAGTTHALALLADGSVLVWGNNAFGALGLGTNTGPENCIGMSQRSKVPRRVPGIANAIAVAATEYHSYALLADGTVLGWGENEHGELGDGVGTSEGCFCVPSPTPIPGISGAIAITAGSHGGGAVLADGTVRNWGLNLSGQLGTGAVSPKAGCACLGPVSPAGLAGVRQLSAGGDHSLALQGSGYVAWGYNQDGEIGNGTESGAPCYCLPAPTTVNSILEPQQVDAGIEHSAALTRDGTIWTWGSNSSGQIGSGALKADYLSPKPVPGVGGASGVVTTDYNTYAIIGPSQTLRVEFAGDESGTVGGGGIVCPPACDQRYPQARVEPLRAQPAARFAGFSGACTGTGVCKVKLDGDRTVTATFGKPKGTRITKAKIVNRKRLARFSFSAPGAITGYECMLVRKKGKRKRARGSAKRGKPRFAHCGAPRKYRNLKPGRYVFRVRALNILGADAKPAKRKFKIKKRKARARPKPKR